MKIAITGPAASGKGTVSRIIARKLRLIHFDAGLVFRFYALTRRNGVLEILGTDEWDYKWDGERASIEYNGRSLHRELIAPEISLQTAELASRPEHFERMVSLCESYLSKTSDVIVDGRSAGTLLLRDADHIFYIDAPVEERARRRHVEFVTSGITQTYENVLEELARRDHLDMTREVNPLIIPDSATYISTAGIDAEEIATRIIRLAN